MFGFGSWDDSEGDRPVWNWKDIPQPLSDDELNGLEEALRCYGDADEAADFAGRVMAVVRAYRGFYYGR